MNEDEFYYGSHILLYAKGHYKKTDIRDDLRILVGDLGSIAPRYIFDADVLDRLLTIWFEFLSKPESLGKTEQEVVRVLQQVGHRTTVRIKDHLDGVKGIPAHNAVWEEMFEALLGFLARLAVKVEDGDGFKILINLAPADPDLLPLSENEIAYRIKQA